MIKKLIKLVLLLIVMVSAGALGGVIAFNQCAGLFSLYQYSGMMPMAEEKTEVVIQENKALKNTIAKVKGAVIEIRVADAKNNITQGSGIILASDGIAAAVYDFYPPGAKAEVFHGGEKIGFEVLKRDKDADAVILKLNAADLPTMGFYHAEDLMLGERVFLAGARGGGNDFFVNEGIVRDFAENKITTSIYESAVAAGAPVFDIEGKILGIAEIAKNGQTSIIPVWKLKEIGGL